MSRLSRAWAALRGKEPAPLPVRYEAPIWPGQFGAVPADLAMTDDQRLAVSVAWACVRAIVDPIASSEVKVYRESEGVRTEDVGGDLWWLLNVEPHPMYTSQAWHELMATRAVAGRGNAYAYIRRDGMAQPFSLQPLESERVTADEQAGGIGYWYDDPVNGRVWILERDMLHVRGPMASSGFYGDSTLARAAAALALARAEEIYATSYYSNGAFPGVVLKAPPNTIQTPEQKQEARSEWLKLFGGVRKAKGMGLLQGGWDLQIIETDAAKAMIVEARKLQVAEILRFFGVPGYLVGIPEASQGYGKNLGEMGKSFHDLTLHPWSCRLAEEFRRKLLPSRRSGQMWFLEYDLSRLKKGDEESIARAEEIGLRTGVLNINLAKAARGLPSVPGGDKTLVGGRPLDQVINPPAPPPAAEPPPEPRMAAAAVLASHSQRAKARAADMAAKGCQPREVERAVRQLRWQARVEMRSAGVRLESKDMDAALESVEQGAEPEKAAERLVA